MTMVLTIDRKLELYWTVAIAQRYLTIDHLQCRFIMLQASLLKRWRIYDISLHSHGSCAAAQFEPGRWRF